MRVLNLGAGVQSTTLYLWAIDGELQIDYAVFADTQSEPRAVYEHVDFLKTLGGPEIITATAGSLARNLVEGVNSTGQRFVSIPAFLDVNRRGKPDGIGRRQCTREYKIDVIERVIRERLGLAKGQRVPPDVHITQIMGLSFDEPARMIRVRDQFRGRKQWHVELPLFDEFVTRTDCLAYLAKRLPGRKVPRSACSFCPFHDDNEWIDLRDNDPEAWSEAVQIDHAIREETSACQVGMESKQYLHRSCVPLDEVQLRPTPPDQQKRMTFSVSEQDCLGYCGR